MTETSWDFNENTLNDPEGYKPKRVVLTIKLFYILQVLLEF